MKTIGKLIKGVLIAFVLVILGIMISNKNLLPTQVESSTPEPLTKHGYLALNYHRVRKDHLITKVLESITVSDELMYYSVYESELEKHMNILIENGVNFLTPLDIRRYQEGGGIPEKSVWISFDDVDVSVYENAFPILKKHQIPFTLFVIAGHVGSNDFENLDLASWQQIQEMVDSGLATVGSHTYDMHKLKDNQAVFFDPKEHGSFLEDITKSKSIIESKLSNVEVLDFAYPYGVANDELSVLVKQAGFKSAYILHSDTASSNSNPYMQNRLLTDHIAFKKLVKPWIKDEYLE